jgi:hypothetical protein
MSALTKIAVLSAFVASLTACQGDGDNESLDYSGVTNQSVISQENAQDLSEVAFFGVNVGTSLTVADARSGPRGRVNETTPVAVARAMHRTIGDIDFGGGPGMMPMPGMMPPMHGDCGGQLNHSIDVDDVALTFTGEFDFDHFCAGHPTNPMHGLTMHGHVTFSGHGHFEGDHYVIDGYTMMCSGLAASTPHGSVTMSGTLESTVASETVYDSLLNMRVRDDHSAMVYRLEDYLVSVDETTDPAHLAVAGRAYHPDHGYVVVSTPTRIEFPHGVPGSPHTGVVLLTGAGGAFGPTTARLRFIDISSYTIAVDEDGDGVPDMTWSCTWQPDACVIV